MLDIQTDTKNNRKNADSFEVPIFVICKLFDNDNQSKWLQLLVDPVRCSLSCSLLYYPTDILFKACLPISERNIKVRRNELWKILLFLPPFLSWNGKHKPNKKCCLITSLSLKCNENRTNRYGKNVLLDIIRRTLSSSHNFLFSGLFNSLLPRKLFLECFRYDSLLQLPRLLSVT